jgi:hypothetical protein
MYQQSARPGSRICCSRDAGSGGLQDTEYLTLFRNVLILTVSCPYPRVEVGRSLKPSKSQFYLVMNFALPFSSSPL